MRGAGAAGAGAAVSRGARAVAGFFQFVKRSDLGVTGRVVHHRPEQQTFRGLRPHGGARETGNGPTAGFGTGPPNPHIRVHRGEGCGRQVAVGADQPVHSKGVATQ